MDIREEGDDEAKVRGLKRGDLHQQPWKSVSPWVIQQIEQVLHAERRKKDLSNSSSVFFIVGCSRFQLESVVCIFLSSLDSNSAVIGPSQRQHLDSHQPLG